MKRLSLYIFLVLSLPAFSQKNNFSIHSILLPPELAYYDNQFSGLYIHESKLFLMSESRLQDSAEAKLYAINLSDLEHKMTDSNFILPYKKYHIYFLDSLRKKMQAAGDDYEGLEAMVIRDSIVYLSVETATPSANCYLVKGSLNKTGISLYPDFLVKMPKPVFENGDHVYNAGFEALAPAATGAVYSFFEYNYFPKKNYAGLVFDRNNKSGYYKAGNALSAFVPKIPFRITDATQTGENNYTAINYFYKGGGDDSVYRVPFTDPNDKLIRRNGEYHNYVRLIDLQLHRNKFEWKTIWEFPTEYSNYNWEGIAAYKKGYFIINDKYTPSRPYSSTLLYLKPE